MKHLSLTFSILMAAMSFFPLGAQVTFENLDLDPSGTLLFSARAESPVFGEYTTLFNARLQDRSITQMTFFPEQITFLDEGARIQIQNRFGVFRTNGDFQNPRPLEAFTAFASGGEVQVGKTPSLGVSPDGRYLVYHKPLSPGYASVYLREVAGDKELLLAERVDLQFGNEGILWSRDSRFFVYAKEESIYYYPVRQYEDDRVLPEEYRSLGIGSIRNVFWSDQGDLYFISGYLVYKVLSGELFTSTLYRNLLERGTLVGKLPFVFDANFDNFWVSPDDRKILLNKGGRNFFVYYLQSSDYTSTGGIISLPYLYLPRNTRIKDVLWSDEDLLTLNAESIRNGEWTSKIYRLDLNTAGNILSFTSLDDRGTRELTPSFDGSQVAVRLDDRVVVRDYQSWKEKHTRNHPGILKVLWVNSKKLLIAGRYYTEIWDLSDGESEVLFLSQSEGAGFDALDGGITATVNGRNFRYNDGLWEEMASGDPPVRAKPRISSSQYRVYLDSSFDRSYSNLVMIRMVGGMGTIPLFDPPKKKFDPFPAKDEPADTQYFRHGSRVRLREIALVFNAVDSADGLTEVLSVLHEYNLKATFFLNGEFIRLNSDAAREIAVSGHEVGSLFYAYFNMTDSRYVVDEEFIQKGLARNEDDYFVATGRELSLLWHAPYYAVSSPILAASAKMNYTYVGHDVDPLDWALEDVSLGVAESLSVSEMVRRIISLKKPGSIIPIRLGLKDQRSGGYLYNNLDVLLNALLEEGYTVVPVSTLIEHER